MWQLRVSRQFRLAGILLLAFFASTFFSFLGVHTWGGLTLIVALALLLLSILALSVAVIRYFLSLRTKDA
jgi:hypothetical protein